MSNLSRNIPLDRIVDLAAKRLAPEERTQLLAQIVDNPQLVAELGAWERCLTLTRSDTSEDAPQYVINRALRFLTVNPTRAEPGPLRRIMAMLCFDSAQTPMPMGIRAPQLNEQQLLFSAEGRDLDLRIIPVGDLWSVTGQVLGVDGNGSVELCNPSVTLQTKLNGLSEFVLPPAPAGVYTLLLYYDDIVVEASNLEVGLLKQK